MKQRRAHAGRMGSLRRVARDRLLAAGLVAVTVVESVVLVSLVPSFGSAAVPRVEPPLVAPVPFSANLSLDAPAVNASVPGGTVLTVSYWLACGSKPSNVSSVVVDVPTVVARIPTSTGAVAVTVVSRNVTVTSNASPSVQAASVNVTLPATSFSTARAHLTSNLFTVMANLPLGSGTLRFQWVWTLHPPGGPDLKGWSELVTLSPAPLANIVLSTASPIPAGTPFTVCLVGPLTGLVMQLRIDLPNGATIASNSASVAWDAGGRFCLATSVPANTAPTPVNLRLWLVSPVDALLHQISGSVATLPFGWIAGNVRPENATVAVDGIPVTEVGPAGNFSIAVGDGLHEVTVTAPGGATLSEGVRVTANRTTSILLVLSAGPAGGVAGGVGPILTGTVVAAAVVAVAAVLLVPRWRQAIPTAPFVGAARRIRHFWRLPPAPEPAASPHSWPGDAPWADERSDALSLRR
ncbi:MAG TPA: PEGA domain-containing protein [Thermoplasmata archaeon]|nr:PEGA domain-containing protein [Thermoplasmata archaeon]